jgi:diguanylate cyclase (GGDEF)-like protein
MRHWFQVVAAALVAAVVVLVGLLVAHERVYGPRLEQAVDAATSARLAHEAMLDQQAGLRAYVLTGDERFLEAYQSGADALPRHVARASSLVSGDEIATELLLAVRLAQQAWLDRWVPLALAAGEEGIDLAEADSLLLDGKRLFDEYRLTHDALVRQLTSNRQRALGAQSSSIVRTAGLALLIVVAVGFPAAWWVRSLRRSIDHGLQDLDAHLQRIRRGDLSPAPGQHRILELSRIGKGLDETAVDLARARQDADDSAARLQRQNQNLGHVLRLAREVAGSLSLRYIVRGLATAASAVTGGRRAVVWLRVAGDGQPRLSPAADTAGPGLEPVGLESVPVGEGPVGRAARFGRVEGRKEPLLSDSPDGAPNVAAVPMVVGAEVVGVLEVHGIDASDLPEDERNVLEALAIQTASAVGAAEVHETTTALAMTDALTHLPNRRSLEADLAKELAVGVRHNRPLGFAMIDVDHFKPYNDTFGHQAGDVALQELAEVLQDAVRAGDTVYRYGGEELAIVMRETDLDGAHGHAERLREAVAHHFAGPGWPRAITISIGVAALPESADGVADLVAAADRALYRAKQAGRNRVESAGGAVSGQMSGH